MKKFNIGVICPSEIAYRRFLPSLKKMKEFEYVGVAVASPEEWFGENLHFVSQRQIDQMKQSEMEKAKSFLDAYGGQIFEGYNSLITSPEIDVIYIPLPPALHFKWAKLVLESGKHAYVEKPFTTSLEDTQILLSIAREKKLVVHENYMFIYHKQLQAVQELIAQGEIGKVRQYRVSFGFPRRAANDFRYNKALGGGALLDAGGYCMKFASWLLGDTARLACANALYEPEFEVDIFGSCTMFNDEGTIVQMSFGMDCDYKCELEAWGSTGTLTTGRILTAPEGLEPDMVIKHNHDYITKKLPADNSFEKSIRKFYDCLMNDTDRVANYHVIEQQSSILNEFKRLSGFKS